MVKVTFKPWEEIIIHESIQYSLENLATNRSVGVPTGQVTQPLLWAEGIAFNHAGMAPTREVIREKLEGRLHWSSVVWALMPEFKPYIEISQTKVKIPIVNVSSNKILSEVAKWLKTAEQH